MKRNLFRKILVFIVIGLFLGVGVFSIHGIKSSFYDRLDQEQTIGRTGWFYNNYYVGFAQSFKPTLDILSRVNIKFCKDYEILVNEIDGTIHLTIRNSLYGNDLTLKSISDNKITTSSLPDWIEFDFPDIDVIPGETYYIVCIWEGSELGPKLGISYTNNYPKGELWHQNKGGHWNKNDEQDIAFRTFGYNSSDPKPIADIECTGSLQRINLKPKVVISGDFTIKNNGYSESKLDWEIIDNPDWGEWTFTPIEGYDLTPFDGSFTVNVLVVTPDEKNQNFTGEIKVINKENTSDYEIIDVSLSTSKTKIINTPFLTFLEKHPHIFPLIRQILGI